MSQRIFTGADYARAAEREVRLTYVPGRAERIIEGHLRYLEIVGGQTFAPWTEDAERRFRSRRDA